MAGTDSASGTSMVSKIGVVGVGTMGAGIAEVFARSGVDVVAIDHDEPSLERGREHIQASTDRAVRRSKLTAEEQELLFARLTFTTNLQDVKDCDLVIEAVSEDMEVKRSVFEQLDRIVKPDTILATNTSALSVTQLSVATSSPARVVGMHFFNPAPVQRLVEVIGTVITDEAVLDRVKEIVDSVGKTPVIVSDRAGFIANGLLMGYLNNAAAIFESKYASREDIDESMRDGASLPMGPLKLLDLIGIDTAYAILDTMYKETRDRIHAPTPLLKQMAIAGLLGRKTGRGFYTYDAPDSPNIVDDALTPKADTEGVAPRPVSKIGVVGTGIMANGITEVLAKAGYETIFVGRGEDKLAHARNAIEKSTERALLRGKIDEATRDAALARITGSTKLDDLADCDLVIEAIVEDLPTKQALFATLDEILKPGAILASNTSSLSIVELAAATKRPEDVIGIHFHNPVPVQRLVEVVYTVRTSADAVSAGVEVVNRMAKHPVTCSDRAGMIVNVMLFPYLNDAVKMLESHYATTDEIDLAMKLGCGYPMGPFELIDLVGLDVTLAIVTQLYREFREPAWAPAPMLEHLVTAGYLGRKTGRGFHTYAH
jgi:3-hydroxybutyryl-CoA dehydrogenase